MGPDSSNLDSPGVHRGEEHHQQQNNQQHNNITRYLYPIQQQNAQHNQHSVRAHSIHCPREAFRQDMTEQLQTWMEKGDLIVLMMDANDDLRDGTTHQWLTETIGLINSLHTKHPHLQPPSTYTRNFRNKPIDGCYISPGLHIV